MRLFASFFQNEEEAMTVLDKSIPYYPVLMVLEQPPVIHEVPLAPGYSFQPYDPSYKEQGSWAAIFCGNL